MSQDYIVIAAGIVFLALIVIGLIRRIRKDGIGSVMDDAVVLKVKEIFIKEIGDVLVNAGLEETYEAFKNQVVYTILDKVREYIDKQGGLIDTITDAIDDDTIIEAIYQAIALSGMEDDIKKAYDTIITNRIKEMESYEEKVAAENAANEAAEEDPVEDDGSPISDEKAMTAEEAVASYQEGVAMGASGVEDV